MNAAPSKIKILLVDDHPVVRKGLQSCLANCENFSIVGEAGDGTEAMRKVNALHPDVVLMDLSMPEMDGLAVTEALHKESPQTKVLVLSMHKQRDDVLRVIKAGACGYVLKDAPTVELIAAIQTVHAGETFFSPAVAQVVLKELGRGMDELEPLARLSDREREVLVQIAQGRSNKEIAAQLGVSVRTVETHRERTMRKLEIRSVAGLTKFALAHGLISL